MGGIVYVQWFYSIKIKPNISIVETNNDTLPKIDSISIISPNINEIDTVQNQQNDNIKDLTETIIELKKELEELKQQQQKTNSPKAVEISSRGVSSVKPDTTVLQQTEKDTTEISNNVTNQQLDDLEVTQIENNTINDYRLHS